MSSALETVGETGPIPPSSPDAWDERLLAWRWFAHLFRAAPDEATAMSLRDGEGAAFRDRLAVDPALAPHLAEMRRLVNDYDDARALTRRMGIAFCHLFLGVGGPSTVAPYESCHLGEKGRMFDTATADMEALLRRLDIGLAADVHEPADHISVELEVMALLVATDDAEAAPFLERLARWMPSFAAACFARDPFGFYAAAASALEAFVERERLALGAMNSR
ncbi:TorD/DmsD family molecular chaperone [Consotaella aegiceratis]|uniref:TorD/DmsD family molecular chaperone n=1 Tax=Consotaella aegiceratis TaxID=3097961 RepID=UPI002F42F53D